MLSSLLLTDFPSGSSINYYKGKLYLIGDDANDILVMDRDYQTLDTINVFSYPDARIPKPVKADFETSCIVKEKGLDHLLVLGSASRSNRMEGILIPLYELYEPELSTNYSRFTNIHFGDFMARLKNSGEINIEGSSVVGNHFLLSNRSNHSNPDNILIITSNDFWKVQSEASIAISKVVLPNNDSRIIGVSELCYVESKDVLLMSLSSEMTANAYDDGVIGDSFIGWIDSISTKLSQPEIELSAMFNLAQNNPLFSGEKIEGVCVESIDNDVLTVHLVSDNDQGHSKLFKLKITF